MYGIMLDSDAIVFRMASTACLRMNSFGFIVNGCMAEFDPRTVPLAFERTLFFRATAETSTKMCVVERALVVGRGLFVGAFRESVSPLFSADHECQIGAANVGTQRTGQE